jgi:hypothetical protein
MVASFLNLSEPCHAHKVVEQRISGENYRILQYSCGPHIWRVWQHECIGENGAHWFGRPYYMRDEVTGMAYYVNRFGELQGGMGADISEAYLPLCGS